MRSKARGSKLAWILDPKPEVHGGLKPKNPKDDVDLTERG